MRGWAMARGPSDDFSNGVADSPESEERARDRFAYVVVLVSGARSHHQQEPWPHPATATPRTGRRPARRGRHGFAPVNSGTSTICRPRPDPRGQGPAATLINKTEPDAATSADSGGESDARFSRPADAAGIEPLYAPRTSTMICWDDKLAAMTLAGDADSAKVGLLAVELYSFGGWGNPSGHIGWCHSRLGRVEVVKDLADMEKGRGVKRELAS